MLVMFSAMSCSFPFAAQDGGPNTPSPDALEIAVQQTLAAAVESGTLTAAQSGTGESTDAGGIVIPLATGNFPLPPTTTPHPDFDIGKLGTVQKNLTYCTVEEINLRMDVYYPAQANRAWPVAMVIHGGGWTGGDKSSDIALDLKDALLAANYLVVSVNYRLAPEYIFPAALEDVKCAVRYLRSHPADFNLDPERIAAVGFSAGAHLADLLGTTDVSAGFEGRGGYSGTSSRVQAVVSLSGPTNLQIFCNPDTMVIAFGASGCDDDATLDRADPAAYITPDDPPFLLFHGDKDFAVGIEFSNYLKRKLDEQGVMALFYVVANAGHAYHLNGNTFSPSFEEMGQLTVQFLDEVMK